MHGPDKALSKVKRVFILMAAPLISLIFLASGHTASDLPQQTFSSPEDASRALSGYVQARDRAGLKALFGPAARELDPGGPKEQAAELEHFAGHLQEGSELERESENRVVLHIGKKKWPFPIPIVKKGDRWFFDTVAGREEISSRRIGRNELLAINACRAYVEAQRQYYDMAEPDGVQIPKYAQKLVSSPGKKDGLYWPAPPATKESPLAPLITKAAEQGYFDGSELGRKGHRPFHGYYFRILKKQGPNAPGGRFPYVINGNMVAGHALIAYPARWGTTGIMTFIVNQRGRVYQKNLGPRTAEIAGKLSEYDPDQSWKLVEEP